MKGPGRGHVKRIKDQVREARKQAFLNGGGLRLEVEAKKVKV